MRCLIGPCVLVLVLVLSLLIGEGFAADTAPPTPTLVKVTMRDGRVVWGELISQHGRQVTLRDLATGNEQRIGKGSIASIDQSVTDNQVAQGCGVEALAAWKTRIISQATLTSTDVGKIARIEDGAIFVTGNQAAVDDKLQVYRETQITDPDTKKLLGTDRKILADLKVTDVSAGFIKAEVVSTPNRGPKPAVGDSVRTEPEALAVAMVAGDDGPAADADKAVLNGILTRLSADDLSIVDTTQTNAAMTALHLAPADVFDSAAAQKLGQKVGASTVIVAKADASAAGSGVGVRVIDVASGQTALSVIAPPPPSLKNSSAFTLTISLHVDGKDEVDIRRDSVTVKHLQDGQPTQIKVNGVDAQVGKPLINSGSTTYLSSKADAMSGQIISKSGRGHLLLLRFHDHIAITFYDPEPGSADYSVTLQFQEKGGAPIAGIPPHPAPAPQPVNDTGTPVADLFSLVGQSGLPRYFTCDQDLISDGRGVTGGRAHTPDTDFGEKDFVLDVVFEFPDGDSRKDAIVGLGEPDHGVGVRLRLPAGDANAAMALGRRTEDAAWASFPSAGPHLLRIQKTGDSLICSMTYNFTGKYRPDALHKIDSVKDAFADMNRLDCPLYFAGDAIFTAVRLEVDGKIMSPGVAPAAIPEPAADQGWITFAPGGALPPGTVPNPKVNIAGDGLCFEEGQCLFSQLRDFTDRDFTLDLVYHFGPDDSDLLQAGLGDPGDNSHRLLAAISGPARNGHISFGHWDLEDLHRDHTGPNLVRLQKRGDTLMFAFCADYKGTFTPDITRIIPSLKAQAPFLAKLDTPVFFGGGGRIERARFLIQGEPIAPVAPPPISNQTVANLISLTGPELPSFLQPQRDLQFKGGLDLTDKRVRSARADLLANDFVADLLFMPPDGHHQAQIGLGGDDRSANANWIDKSVWVGINSPDGGGSAQLHIGHSSWDFGHYTGAGPHLLRVEKRGKTLTFSFCENFSGKFEPQFVRSVPDIRAVAPDMDPHNAFFFMDGGAIVQSMAFSVNQQPAESHDIPLALPPAVTEGQPIRVQVARLPAGSTFAADAAAPPGLSISASGQLAWTPTHAEVGPHEFQVRITTHGRTVSETVQITVVSAADAGALHGNLAQLDRLYALPLKEEKHDLTLGRDQSLLLLEGDTLRRLGSDGFTVRQTLHLPKAYNWIGERNDYFVALSSDKKCLDMINKDSLKVQQSLQMQYYALHDLCLVPGGDISYVMVEKSTSDGLEPQILIVNERTGDVHEPDDFGGTFGKVSPDGKSFYVGYKDIYEKGERLLFNPDHIDVIPDYGDIDILIVYDVSRPTQPVLVSAKNDAGGNGFGIAVSADGTKVSYLSFVGYPLYSKNIAAWDPTDLTKRPVSYPTKDNKGDCKYLAFHPMLPIAAAPAETGAICFDQNTGELQPDRLDFGPALGEVKVNGLIFSPDGKNLILDCANPSGTQFFLRRVKLNLSADELKQVQRGPAAPAARPVPRPQGNGVPKASADGPPPQFALQSQP